MRNRVTTYDDTDLARVSADRRNIAVGWVVVFTFIALGVIAPAVAPMVLNSYAVVMARVAPSVSAVAAKLGWGQAHV
jgi:hypothetical protein